MYSNSKLIHFRRNVRYQNVIESKIWIFIKITYLIILDILFDST